MLERRKNAAGARSLLPRGGAACAIIAGMAEFWETAFTDKQLMWGLEPTGAAKRACELFAQHGAREVLVPGVGYGRNARPFLAAGMNVTGIEISETAIALARSALGLDFPIHHGSVSKMPFDDRLYDGIFAFALLHLLDEATRRKFIADCFRQLSPGGHMVFTTVSKLAPQYRQGTRLGDDWYELPFGVRMYFYDHASIRRDFAAFGLVDSSTFVEPANGLPFEYVVCRKD